MLQFLKLCLKLYELKYVDLQMGDIDHTADCLMRTFDLREAHPVSSVGVGASPARHLSHFHSAP